MVMPPLRAEWVAVAAIPVSKAMAISPRHFLMCSTICSATSWAANAAAAAVAVLHAEMTYAIICGSNWKRPMLA
jgi:hypothetical protein